MFRKQPDARRMRFRVKFTNSYGPNPYVRKRDFATANEVHGFIDTIFAGLAEPAIVGIYIRCPNRPKNNPWRDATPNDLKIVTRFPS